MTVRDSNQLILFKALFPLYCIQENLSDIEEGAVFLKRPEIFSILGACRMIRFCDAEKMLIIERAFENVISILCKVPWYESELISTLQRGKEVGHNDLKIISLRC